MAEADSAVVRLGTALSDAACLPSLLAAAGGAFDFIAAAAQACEDQRGRILPWWAMAGAAAIAGWHAVTSAPSFRPQALPGEGLACAECDDQAARAIAHLTSQLAVSLAAAVTTAGDGGDIDACHDAARHAVRISELLSPQKR